MSKFASSLAPYMEQMLCHRKALGYSPSTHHDHLLNLDRFCQQYFPHETGLSQEMVLKWMRRRPRENYGGLQTRASAIRCFAAYLDAHDVPAYILPDRFVGGNNAFVPHIFTDSELSVLFAAMDDIRPTARKPFIHLILPVLFRLTYTCGLRPNEGRELLVSNVRLDTGEVLITETKRRKERIIVMSDDMLSLCRVYDAKRRIFAPNNAYFFPNPDGGTFSNQWVLKQFKKCWKKANSDKPAETLPDVRVYDLRHRFASAVLNRWLDEKRDLYAMLPYLRTYMGHGELSSTAYYIHLLPKNLVKSAGIDWASLTKLIPEVSEWPE